MAPAPQHRVEFTGEFVTFAGTPDPGTITFRPVPAALVEGTPGVSFDASPTVVTVEAGDVTARWTRSLPAAPGLVYRVAIRLQHRNEDLALSAEPDQPVTDVARAVPVSPGPVVSPVIVVVDAPGGDEGGGGGAPATSRRVGRITSGDVDLQATPGWVLVLELGEIPAVAGDDVELSVTAMRNDSESAAMALAVINGEGEAVRYLSTWTATPPVAGDPGWYADTAGEFPALSGPMSLDVAPSDLTGGAVRFGVMANASGPGSRLYASSSFPVYWQARNYGATERG